MSWTNQQEIFSLEIYFATKSYQSVQIQFWKLPLSQLSTKITIVTWVTKLGEHGTVVDLFLKPRGTYSGRKDSARKEENIAVVRGYTVQLNVRTRHSDSLVIPSSWLCLRTYFLGLRPTEFLTAAIFSSVLALLCHSEFLAASMHWFPRVASYWVPRCSNIFLFFQPE